jgi:hypothetical protein
MLSRLLSFVLCCAPVVAQQKPPITLDESVQLLRAAMSSRTAPLTFDIPRGNMNWNVQADRLNQDTYMLNFRPERGVEFQLQLTICELDKKAIWSDATLLGPKETADAFYTDNLKYLLFVNDVDYVRCGLKGMRWSSQPLTDGRSLYTSEDRLLKHMCNWMSFLVRSQTPERALDFMKVIMTNQREVLVAADKKQEYDRVANRIELFDAMFPFAAFDGSGRFAAEDREAVRAWLETTLAERRKLKVLAPTVAQNISRDETLLKKFAQSGGPR